MPPQKIQNTTTAPPIPQRRSRKESLKEDLDGLLSGKEQSDETFLLVLKQAMEESVDLEMGRLVSLFDHFIINTMIKSFEELFMHSASRLSLSLLADRIGLVYAYCETSGMCWFDISLRMIQLFLSQIRQFNNKAAKEVFFSFHGTIQFAIDYNRMEFVRPILEKAKQFPGGCLHLATSSLIIAVESGLPEAVALVLEHSTPDKEKISELALPAAKLRNSKILEMLLDAGADIEVKKKKGETPLFTAIRCGSVECVKLLVERGCDFSLQMCHEISAIRYAIECYQSEILKVLLESALSNKAHKRAVLHRFETDLSRIISNDDAECFRVAFPFFENVFYKSWSIRAVEKLIAFSRCEMLSFVFFESLQRFFDDELTDFLSRVNNDEIRKLIKKKIDIMEGRVVDLKVEAVKKEEVKVEQEN